MVNKNNLYYIVRIGTSYRLSDEQKRPLIIDEDFKHTELNRMNRNANSTICELMSIAEYQEKYNTFIENTYCKPSIPKQ